MHSIKASSVKMFTWNFPFLVFVLMAAVVSVDAQRSCTTPNNAYGQCVGYRECSYFKQQIEVYGSQIPQEFRDFIKKSRCPGPNKETVFVCCERAFIQQPTTTTPSPITPVIDVSNQEINPRGFQVLNAIRCGEIKGNKVAHGNKTKLNEFTFMALLMYDIAEIYACGGSVITNRFVLTAAHCWVGQKVVPYAVRLGEHDYNKDEDCGKQGREIFCNPPVEDYGIDKFIPHQLYNPKKIDNDIGLIRLDRDVSFKIHIHPICLPIHEDSQRQALDSYIIAGWGTTETTKTSSLLLQAVIPHRTKEFCQKVFPRYVITDDLICAGGDDLVDSCKGDSGGPLFFQSPYNRIPRFVQYGVVSNGVVSCGERNYPTVYTKIISFLPWITNAIAENL